MIQKTLYRAGRLAFRVMGYSANERRLKGFTSNVISAEAGNVMLHDIICKGKPAMISRLGVVEANALLNYLEIKDWEKNTFLSHLSASLKCSRSNWTNDVKNSLRVNAGFFPNTEEMIEIFSAYFLEQIKEIDALGIWKFVPGESYFHKHYCPEAIPFCPESLEPYYFSSPWTSALKGKKVLVIHPFTHSIIKQYQLKNTLFKNRQVLPEFELKTIKAVQSIAGNQTEFVNWFQALEYLQKQIDTIEFDVALIGAGSYGLPLASYIKKKGKIAIHVGGAIQILFGIKGKRWDDHPKIAPLYNENWVRPDKTELVPEAQKVEGGCYW